MEELPVSEHLGPKAALVVGLVKFREKPVHVWGDGRTGPGRIDRHRYLLRAPTRGKKNDGHCRRQNPESWHPHESPHLVLALPPRIVAQPHLVASFFLKTLNHPVKAV
jgi:hypothetical protein